MFGRLDSRGRTTSYISLTSIPMLLASTALGTAEAPISDHVNQTGSFALQTRGNLITYSRVGRRTELPLIARSELRFRRFLPGARLNRAVSINRHQKDFFRIDRINQPNK